RLPDLVGRRLSMSTRAEDVEDWAVAVITFEDGTKATVHSNDITLGGVRNVVTAYLTNGVVHANINPNTTVAAYAPDGAVWGDEDPSPLRQELGYRFRRDPAARSRLARRLRPPHLQPRRERSGEVGQRPPDLREVPLGPPARENGNLHGGDEGRRCRMSVPRAGRAREFCDGGDGPRDVPGAGDPDERARPRGRRCGAPALSRPHAQPARSLSRHTA